METLDPFYLVMLGPIPLSRPVWVACDGRNGPPGLVLVLVLGPPVKSISHPRTPHKQCPMR